MSFKIESKPLSSSFHSFSHASQTSSSILPLKYEVSIAIFDCERCLINVSTNWFNPVEIASTLSLRIWFGFDTVVLVFVAYFRSDGRGVVELEVRMDFMYCEVYLFCMKC